MIEVVVCKTGMERHDRQLPARVAEAGACLGTVDCFDRCEVCERWLIAKIDGITTRFRTSAELVDALEALKE